MRPLWLLLTTTLLAQPPQWQDQTSNTKASLRGIVAVSPRIAWASGTGGTVLRTTDGGDHWQVIQVPDAAQLDFRGIQAFNDQTALIMSSGEGDKSRIYKTADGGAHWTLLHTNPDPKGFYDALLCTDAKHCRIMGDPVAGRFVIRTTADGGATWNALTTLPEAGKDEGAFAASNTSLVYPSRNQILFATGGPSGARVYQSRDQGRTWTVAQSPIRHDGPGCGIFSLAFRNSREGIAVGGNYQDAKAANDNWAVTQDGGRTWTKPEGTSPRGYRSAVANIPGTRQWIAVGTTGSDYSADGTNWQPMSDTGFNALALIGNTGWAVGPQGRIARLQPTSR